MNTSWKFVDFRLMMTISYVRACARNVSCVCACVCIFHVKNQSICVTVFGLFSCIKYFFRMVASDHVECFMNELWNCQCMRFAHGLSQSDSQVSYRIYAHTPKKGPNICVCLIICCFVGNLSFQCLCSTLPILLILALFRLNVVVSELWAITGNQFEQIRYIYQLFTSFYLSSVIH